MSLIYACSLHLYVFVDFTVHLNKNVLKLNNIFIIFVVVIVVPIIIINVVVF